MFMTIGIDEVGRGCWAGPLVAAAVGFDNAITPPVGLNDSKKLSPKKRIELTTMIHAATTHIGVGWVWPKEINKLGLTKSVKLAMVRAIKVLQLENASIIIDGNINYLQHLPNTTAVVKADGSVAAVSAASIIAKVARDTYMINIAKKYPQFGFEKHVGYGTKQHVAALKKYGVLSLHRVNYKPIQKILAGSS